MSRAEIDRHVAALSANEPARSDHGFNGHGPAALFARWNRDADGKVAVADLPEKMKSHLAQADANQNGVFTREELVDLMAV